MRLRVKVSPNAKQNEITGWFGDQLKIKISASPERGKANKELVNFLAKELSISRSGISILRGHTSSSKVLNIENCEKQELESRLGIRTMQEALL